MALPLLSGKASAGGLDLCVVGNLTIDVLLRGVTSLPQWGHETIGRDRSESVAGQAATLAFGSAALGLRTHVVGAVGDDGDGHRVRDALASEGIGVGAVTLVARGRTPLTVAFVRPDGERAFVSDLGALVNSDVLDAGSAWTASHQPRVVALVGTFNLPGVDIDAIRTLFRTARDVGALTVFDPGWDPAGWSPSSLSLVRAAASEADLFMPNLDEAVAISGERDVAAMFAALSALGRCVTIVKAGAEGSYVVAEEEIVNVRALPTAVDNAVGAGDVFNAGVIASLASGASPVDAMALGTAAASHYVSRREDRFASFDECSSLAARAEVVRVSP